MNDEKETKQKLILSAKKEFMEKGFLQASLRAICKNAGVTTGALYFFFQDKEDLFAHVVDGPVQKITELMQAHYAIETANGYAGEFNQTTATTIDYSDDVKTAREVIHVFFTYYDELQLILTKSQGTRYEQIVDQFVEITEIHYKELLDVIADHEGKPRKDASFIHWMAHMHIDVFIHLITHAKDEQDAQSQMDEIMIYLMYGFKGLFRA